jgi:hypothetical protein
MTMTDFTLTVDQINALSRMYGTQSWWKQVSYDATTGVLSVPDDHAADVQNFDYSAASAAAVAAANKLAAQAALDKSDITMLRCLENSVAIPSDWVTYRHALRTCVTSGDALPVRPAFPQGT